MSDPTPTPALTPEVRARLREVLADMDRDGGCTRMAWADEAVNALPALLDAADERDKLAAEVGRARASSVVVDGSFEAVMNMNDTFDYATSDAEAIDLTDFSELAPVISRHGPAALTAYASLVRGDEPIEPLRTAAFLAAKEEIAALKEAGKIGLGRDQSLFARWRLAAQRVESERDSARAEAAALRERVRALEGALCRHEGHTWTCSGGPEGPDLPAALPCARCGVATTSGGRRVPMCPSCADGYARALGYEPRRV